MNMNIEQQLQIAFNDLETILRVHYYGIISDKFIKIVDETKEAIKNKEQTYNNLTVEIALQIDKSFDEFLKSKG